MKNNVKLEFLVNARALYSNSQSLWVAKGMNFWRIDLDGNRIGKKYTVGGLQERLLSCNRLSSQLLRIGIHHILPLQDGNVFVVSKKYARVFDKDGKVLSTFTGYRGNKPAQFGICQADNGNIFFGEYTININNTNETTLYRSTDGGKTFCGIYTFPRDVIRHIHFVQWDPYENCLWMGTGDKDNECMLMRSFNYGETWEIVGKGTQRWRAIGVVFTKDYLYWGTDAGSVPDQNYVMRMSRKDYKLENVFELDGPCHGITSLANGDIYLCAGVEGGENETDKYARLYRIHAGTISVVLKMKKDIFPLILQYGVIHFPHGLSSGNKLFFTSYGLTHGGEKTFKI